MSMAASGLLLRSSALGLCLALSAPAWAAEPQPLDSIMKPGIMSQMVMLDEPVAPAPVQVADAGPDPIIQTQGAQLVSTSPATDSRPQPIATQMSTTIPEHAVTPLPNPPPVRQVEAPATSIATPPPAVAPAKAAEDTALPKKDYVMQPDTAKDGKQLTLEDVIALAIKNSPERDIAHEQVNQAIASVDEARSNYYPQISAKAEAGREYNNPYAVIQGATTHSGYSFGNNSTLNLRQMLYDGFITRETVKQRMQLVESSQLSKAKVTEELIKSTTEVYMELYQFQQVVVASAENLDALRDIAKMIDLRVKAGDASKAEQNYLAARVASAEQSYITSQAALKDAFSALAYLIGPVQEFDAIPPSLAGYMTSDPEDIVAKATTRSTDARLVDSDQKAAVHDLRAAKGRFMPEVALVMDGSHAEDLGGQTGIRDYGSLKAQVSYKIFDGGLRSATTQRQYAKIREIEARQDRVKREITQTVSRDYNQQQTTVKELKVAEDEIVANTDLEVLYRKQFKQGDIDITNLVESQERIYSARIKKYKLESDMVNVTFAILRSTAEMLPKFCGNNTGC